MTESYKERAQGVDRRVGALFKAAPKPMGAYNQLMTTASADGVLDSKTKELMALAISIALRCEDCIAYHTRAAIKHKADESEVVETIAVAVEMGGGPAAVYGARAFQAYKDLAA